MKKIISKKDNGRIKIITGLRNARLGFRQLELDFVVNQAGKRFYVQSALSIADPEKKNRR